MKYKKHEWVVLAFVKEDMTEYLYTNKGENRFRVSLYLDEQYMISFCKDHGIQTIIRFHNHPNSNPRAYDGLGPSGQDLISANYLGNYVMSYGLNWLDFVCERGRFMLYHKSVSDRFYPRPSKYITIMKENQTGDKQKHYKMHRELGLFS